MRFVYHLYTHLYPGISVYNTGPFLRHNPVGYASVHPSILMLERILLYCTGRPIQSSETGAAILFAQNVIPQLLLIRIYRLGCCCSFCIRATYCFETVFQACMYFSMHVVKQVSSPLEREVPGLGTQRSKQCSLSFWKHQLAFVRLFLTIIYSGGRTSTSWRAFCMAASCWIWRMICVLGSLLEKALRPPAPKESMICELGYCENEKVGSVVCSVKYRAMR